MSHELNEQRRLAGLPEISEAAVPPYMARTLNDLKDLIPKIEKAAKNEDWNEVSRCGKEVRIIGEEIMQANLKRK